jgi:hypothetical protein
MRTKIKVFISYAHANKDLVSRFVRKFEEYTRPSLNYEYQIWWDKRLLIGEDWQMEIINVLEECDFGLLMVSASFLGSRFIEDIELDFLSSKPILPVMLWPIDLKRHDLKGIKKKQIFRLDRPGLTRPKSFGECTNKQREEFMLALFQQVENRLDKLTRMNLL